MVRLVRVVHLSPVLFALASAACGSAFSEDDIQAPMGGLDFRAEAPLFGDAHRPDFVAAGESEATQAVEGPQRAAPPATVAIWAVWGRHPQSARPDTSTRWDGSLRVSGGTLELKRTLAFDRADGVDPSRDEATVTFHSRTRPHVDGLVALAHGATSAQLDTAALDAQLDVGGTGVGRAFVASGDQEEAATLLALPLPADGTCANAVFSARPARVPPTARARGVDRRWVGRAFAPDGALLGHWRAFAGTRRDGTRVLFGKLVDEAGNTRALMSGTPSADGQGLGVELQDADGNALGSLAVDRAEADGTPSSLPRVASLQRCL